MRLIKMNSQFLSHSGCTVRLNKMYVLKWFLLKSMAQSGKNTFTCSTIEITQIAVVSTNSSSQLTLNNITMKISCNEL